MENLLYTLGALCYVGAIIAGSVVRARLTASARKLLGLN